MQPALTALLSSDVPLDKNIVLIDSPEFDDTLNELIVSDFFACDIETYSERTTNNDEIHEKNKDALDPWKGFIRLIQVALPQSRRVLVIDLGGREYKPVLYPDRYRRFGQVFLQKLMCPKTKKGGHNFKFDMKFLSVHLGATFRNVWDTMLMSQILWSGVGVEKAKLGEKREDRCKLPHTLKGVVERLQLGDLDKTDQKSDWGGTLSNHQLNYAAHDALIAIDVYERLKVLLLEAQQNYPIYTQFLFLPVLADMEVKGTPVDMERVDSYLEIYQKAIEYHTQVWYSEFPDIPHSATKKDLLPALNKRYNLQLKATNDEALAPLASQYPAIQALLDYRTLNISYAYLNSIKRTAFNGCVRGNYRQITGGWRTSCKNLNLQNVAKLHPRFKQYGYPNIKSVFKPSEDYAFLVADLSAAHARICTQVTRCAALIKGYNEGTDNHVVVSAKVLAASGYQTQDTNGEFHTVTETEALEAYASYKRKKKNGEKPNELENKVAEYRDYGKIGFYSYLNQAGPLRVQTTFAGWGIDVTVEFCELLISVLTEIYGDIRKYIKEKLIPYANSFDIDFSHFNDVNGKPLEGKYGVTYGLTGGRNFCLKQKSKFGELQVPYTDTISFTWLSSEANMLEEVAGLLYLQFLDNPQWEARICNYVHDIIRNVVYKLFYCWKPLRAYLTTTQLVTANVMV